MPNHPNFEFATALWDAVAQGDSLAVRALLAEDVVWHAGGSHPLSGEFRGRDAVIDYLARVGETADELSTELTDIFVNDRGAVVVYHLSARRELKRLETDLFLELEIRDSSLKRARSVSFDQVASNEFWS
jgi:ketosteroid isomerase-like protein